jgi:protein TonB
MPCYPGGKSVLKRYLNKSLSLPGWVEQQNITGTVTVAFTVNIDGKTSSHEIIKSIDPSLDKEAIRLVKKSGFWVRAANSEKQVIYRNRIDKMFPIENAN